ncbi:MAG: hypothetical protein EKK64_06770 [Neisseriaceae bacterium]|nr:MAG: hypothetical protein EKK64_06770 [Neisseriaceae bacterium]
MMTIVIRTPFSIVKENLKTAYLNKEQKRKNFKDVVYDVKDRIWIKDNYVHRDKDLPAVENFCGTKHWYLYGRRHRDNNKPAVVFSYNKLSSHQKEHFFIHGKKYIINQKDGFKEFLFIPSSKFSTTNQDEAILHSINGMPSVVFDNGTKEWYFDGKLHREKDKPAIEYSNGDKEYWFHGARHRWNGPAVICGDKQYWFHYGEFIRCIA